MVSWKLVVLAATFAMVVKPDTGSSDLDSSNPVSLLLLSAQDNATFLYDNPTAVNAEGAAGKLAGLDTVSLNALSGIVTKELLPGFFHEMAILELLVFWK